MQKGARLSSYKIINDTGLRFCKCHFFPWKVLIPFLCAVFILRYLHQWLRWGDKVEKQKKVIFWHSTRFTSGKFFSAFSSHFFFASLRYSSSLAISVFFFGMFMFCQERKYLLVTKQHLLLQETMTLLLLQIQFFFIISILPSTSLM